MRVFRICALTAVCFAVVLVIALYSSAGAPAKIADVNEARVMSETGDGSDWLLNGRTFDEQHFSPLRQITDQNIGGLGLAWYLDIDSAVGVVAEPIVVDGVIYLSAPLSKVYAVDAASGKLLWMFDPKVRLNLAINGSYSARTNGGVAVWNGKVYVGTGDCRLVAIDAASGRQAWEASVCEATQTGITGAPHVARGKVFMGYNGSDDGVRGSMVAYDAETGQEVWRFWTVPGDPSKPFETKALAMAAKTWIGKDAWRIGGGDAWNAITYDPLTGFLIFGTAGAGVDYGELSSIKARGDKLFAGCILAVNADTGEYVWHFQTSSPGLQTENNHIMLADLTLNGEKRHVAMTAPKNGFFYILDARTGKLLGANPLVKLAWANSYNLETGRAKEVPAPKGGLEQWTVHNWWPMSYSPLTGLVYLPTTDRKPKLNTAVENGEWMPGTEGRLIAWDPIGQSARWSVEEPIATNGGVLSTAGNLVFQGQGNGEFAAYAAESGKKVWSIQTGSAIDSVPVTFSVKGEQYILTPVGWGSGSRLFAPAWTMATPQSKRGPARLLAFKLAATMGFPTPPDIVPPVPKPPTQVADPETIRKGSVLYGTFVCDGCHSPGTDGSGAWVLNGAVPDLRYMPPEAHQQWYSIVLSGSHWKQGMPGFADPPKFAFPHLRMTKQDADAIHAYVIDQSWKAYRSEQENAHNRRENY
ncbi:MAG TPA: PQQ-binding-like beta-propeller repeat protein [Terriglobales bacterium]|nr:PQQ-binding-like beta-propeller repeat protein [Terriglobales bacterium]